MLRDFRISELRTLVNSVIPSILRKNLIRTLAFAIALLRSLPMIHDQVRMRTKTVLKIVSFAFFDNSRFMTTE